MSFFIIFIGILFVTFISIFVNNNYSYPNKIKKIDALIKLEDFDKALSLLNKLPEVKKILPEIQMKFFDILYKQKNYYLCLYHLTEIKKRNIFTSEVSEMRVCLSIAEIYEKMGKFKKAIEAYHYLIQKDSEHLIANEKIALIFYRMKNYGGALPFLEKSYALKSSSNQITYCLSHIYYYNGLYQRAYHIIDEALKVDSKENRFILLKAKCAFFLEQFEEIITLILLIENDKSFQDETALLKGLVFYHQKKINEGSEIFEKTLPKIKNDYQGIVLEARYLYANFLLEKRKLQESLIQLQMTYKRGKPFKKNEKIIEFLVPIVKKYPFVLKMFLCKDESNFNNYLSGVAKNKAIKMETIEIMSSFFAKIVVEEKDISLVFGINIYLEDKKEEVFLDQLKAFAISRQIKSIYYYSARSAVDLVFSKKYLNSNQVKILDNYQMNGFLEGNFSFSSLISKEKINS